MRFGKISCVFAKSLVTVTILSAVVCACSTQQNREQNRLQFASSPYLKEHADNPVDWYEWGSEALNKAKQEDKPLLISIGYASCHWCHEMEKESFMDTAVARIMNENFICIKVDREERPDIDQVYMNALQLLTGDGGWPLNAFALPDGKPFFAGTYFEKNKWAGVLTSISKAYRNKHNLVVTQANALVNGIAEQELSFTGETSIATKPLPVAAVYDSVYKQADLVNGGLKGTQKFPTPAFIEFLLQHHYITGNPAALGLANTTLTKMALGGIYDHAGGGFARYTTDSFWRVPHFEKMLYDNGQLASVYAHAYQLTGNEFYREKIAGIIAFADNALAAPGGGFYSSLNADTEDGEGVFYAWSLAEFMKAAGADNSLAAYYHVTEKGNWKPSLNILYADQTPSVYAASHQLDVAAFKEKLAGFQARLLQLRSKRIQPTVDTKIITAWNCIMLKGYADAYAATGSAPYLSKARACAAFIEKNMMGKDGSLLRNFTGGKAAIEGFLDDYAWATTALIRLYELNFESHWLELAKKTADYAIGHFYNEKTGLFFYARSGSELVLRKTEIADEAIPSSNAIMAKALYTLGKMYDDTTYTGKVERMSQAVAQRAVKMPRYFIQWGILNELRSAKSYEVVVAGKDALVKNRELQQHYLPTSITMGTTGPSALPLLQNRLVAGKTMIYVCSDKVCKRPEEEPGKALAQLKKA